WTGGRVAHRRFARLEGERDRFRQRELRVGACIGAWVGIIYNQAKDGKGLEATQAFFRNVFRDDESFRSFPTNTIFSPDWFGYLDAMQDFLCEPQNYRNAFVPRKMMESFLYTLSGLRDRKNWKHFS